jgi:hypothetical protein
MKRTLLFFLLIPFLPFAQNQRVTELTALAQKIQNDPSGKDVLNSLKPTMEDYQGLYQTVNDVGDTWMYTEDAYLDIDMKPIQIPAEYTEIQVITMLVAELKPGVDNGFPEEYAQIANRMKPTAKIYLVEYRKPGTTDKISLHIFFHVNNRWVYIPTAFKAFE